MKILEREIDSITYQAGQTRTIQLPRNYAYRSLQLKLVAQMDRDAQASDGDIKDSCPAQLIRNITIRANGRDVIKSIDLETLHRLDQLRWGTRPHLGGSEGFDGYATKSNIVMTIHAQLDFAMWRSIKPIDSLLDSAGLATLEMIVTFGNPNDVMTDAFDGDCSVDSATLYVSSQEYVGVPADTTFLINKEYMIRSQVNATSSNHQIQLPVGNMYRSFVLKTHSDGVQVDTILDNIVIKSGTEVFKNRIAPLLQMDNRLECGIEVPETDADAGTAQDHYFAEYCLEGYYLLEFCKDGRLTEALDTRKLSGLELLLDVNAVGTDDFIDVFPCELLMPAKAV